MRVVFTLVQPGFRVAASALTAATVIANSAVSLHAQEPFDASPALVAALANNPGEDRERALGCLTQAIVYEAANEPVEGQQAVAQVIVNRTRTSQFPASICGVIYQGSERSTGCQFTFTCDGSLRRRMPDRYLLAARPIAEAALNGTLPDRVGSAMFYHAYYVTPRWAPLLNRVARIGAHIFYRSNGAPAGVYASILNETATGPRVAQAAVPDRRPFSPWGLPLAQ